jgi:hypothetical protein|tara:strand:- start:205 stop:372 length:168 start_codon:yes stop_codon:yes gene_type:complete
MKELLTQRKEYKDRIVVLQKKERNLQEKVKQELVENGATCFLKVDWVALERVAKR